MSKGTILYANTINFAFDLQQRPHHILKILSDRGWHVIWCNQYQDKNILRERLNENLTIYHNWEVCKKRHHEVDIYFSTWSYRFVDLEDIKCKLVLYDSVDNFKENSIHEKDMIDKSDIVFTTSKPLYDIRKHEHNNVNMCRNACFPECGLADYNIPDDLNRIKQNGKPIILFSGAVAGHPQNGWVDINLMELISQKYNLVIVGKLWGIQNPPTGSYFLGNKNYAELQAYYHHCDVSILPFRVCQTSIYSNPIKIYEALAHGKITVSTNIPESYSFFNSVLVSKDNNEFIDNIEFALKVKDKQSTINKCLEYASENSWYKRVDVIEESIQKYCTENNISFL
ncbi:MAG: glycosyltransferase [Syntrophothermus sp.]